MARRRSRYSHYSDYRRYSAARPLEAKEGIKAKSQRGPVGETWWSQRFITVLESFRIGARLQRGLRYARTGQVLDLTVAPGLVTAKVQGTRRTPYKIRIEVDTLKENDWTKVEAQLAAQAGYLARLLAGEMPRDVEEAFATCRLSLFPASTQQVRTSCSCPDWSNPCKHIAASYYLLAERFDEDPFLVFAWRGRPRGSLLTNLRALRAVTPAPPRTTPDAPVEIEPPPNPASFWTVGSVDFPVHLDPDLQTSTPPREAGPTTISLGGRDLSAWLEDVYAVVTTNRGEP